MSTPIPPVPDHVPTPAVAPSSRSPRWRPRGRTAVVGAALVALLVVAGVAAALLAGSDRPGPPRDVRPDLALAGATGELGAREGGDGLAGLVGPDDEPGEGPRRQRRGAPLERGLGDDALLVGAVVATADGSIVLAPDGGAPQRTIRTDDRTRVRGNGNTALGDLQPGERVVVRVDGTGDAATAVAVVAPQARVTGTVTALAGDTATITAVDGLTVTADVAALGRKPAVGDLVVLTGTAGNGTTIKADTIRILPRAA